MKALSTYDAGLIVAMEQGRHFAEHGLDEVRGRLTRALAAGGLHPPSDREVEVSFEVTLAAAAADVRAVGISRGLTPEQADEIAETMLVAAHSGRTQ